MGGNTLVEIIKESMPIVNSSISAVVGAIITTLFLRKNTNTTEFEKIKAGQFKDVIDGLLDSGKMSYLEYYKTKNFLEIAKKADEFQNRKSIYEEQEQTSYDFDWYIRFFEAASNIRNEDMQNLWAAILAGEVEHKGSFSLRTLDTLYNMTQEEAAIFAHIAKIVLDNAMIFSSMGDVGQNVNEKYGFNNDVLRLLEEIGLINGLRMESCLELEPGESGGFENDGYLLLIRSNSDKLLRLTYKSYSLTMVGIQLFQVVYQSRGEFGYLYDLGKAIQTKYPNLILSIHPIKEIEDDCVSYDSEINLLK